jgi:hypothetical protein
MVTRKDDFNEPAIGIASAILKARQLNLPTSACILSMVPVEVSEAIKAATEEEGNDAAG